jgi:hypothetical protein
MELIKCDNCEQEIPRNRHGEIEYVATVMVKGGYSWFYDDIESWPKGEVIPFRAEAVLQLHDNLTLLFCHDCCVKLWDEFPAMRKSYGQEGLHPKPAGEEPCCRYSF